MADKSTVGGISTFKFAHERNFKNVYAIVKHFVLLMWDKHLFRKFERVVFLFFFISYFINIVKKYGTYKYLSFFK